MKRRKFLWPIIFARSRLRCRYAPTPAPACHGAPAEFVAHRRSSNPGVRSPAPLGAADQPPRGHTLRPLLGSAPVLFRAARGVRGLPRVFSCPRRLLVLLAKVVLNHRPLAAFCGPMHECSRISRRHSVQCTRGHLIGDSSSRRNVQESKNPPAARPHPPTWRIYRKYKRINRSSHGKTSIR